MNPSQRSEMDYINFLVATQKAYSCTEAARVQPEQDNPPAHDALTRLLHRLYDKPAVGATKNDHFRQMLATVHGRGFQPP